MRVPLIHRSQRGFFGCLGICGSLLVACSSSERPPTLGNARGGSAEPSAGGRAAARGGAASSGAGRSGRSGVGGTSSGGVGGNSDAGTESGGTDGGGLGGDRGGSENGSGGSENGSGGSGQGGIDPTYLCPSDSSGGMVPSIGSQCDPQAAWNAGEPVGIEASGLDNLIAMTPDELSLVWFVAGGSAGAYLLADRASIDAAFESPMRLASSGVIALSPDGLRVVSRSPEGGYLEQVRSARGGVFGEPVEGAFTLLNAAVLATGYTLEDCVFSPDDRSLYYNISGDDADAYPLRLSTRTGDEPWPLGDAVEACELKAFGSIVRHPTAVSADGLTLFFFDPARNAARAAFRRTLNGPFLHFTDLGERRQAQPNQACDRLYYSASDDSSVIMVAAE